MNIVQNRLVDIIGPGPSRITVTADSNRVNPFEILRFDRCPNVLVTGLTIQNGGTEINGSGGAIRARECRTVTISNCEFWHNKALDSGGAVFLGDVDHFALYDSYFYGNEALGNVADSGGGAIFRGGFSRSTIVHNSSFVQNITAGSGGAIALADGAVNVTGSYFLLNEAGASGGAINWSDPLFRANSVLNIGQSTFDNNAAGQNGGGVNSAGGVSGTIRSTFRANTAVNLGGGIHDPAGNLNIMGSTIASNAAPDGGGVYANVNGTGSGSFVNSIIAGNTATNGGPDVSGAFTSLGHNLIGITDGSTGWDNTDRLGSSSSPLDPKLNPLGFYGGPTQTMTLQVDSPALDAGDNSYVDSGSSVDQRGYTRIVNGTVDIGAVEMQAGEFSNTPPVASPAAFSTVHDTTLTIPAVAGVSGLLTFATDADGDPLTVVAINGSSAAIGNAYPTSLGGTVTVQADGSFVYAPPLLTVGIDKFTYTVADVYASSTAEVKITLTNNAPVVNEATYSTKQDQTLSVAAVPNVSGLLTFASDADNDVLTVTAINDSPLVNGSITLTSLNGGTLTVNADGSFDYVPAAGSQYDDVFTFTISDGITSVTGKLTIQVLPL